MKSVHADSYVLSVSFLIFWTWFLQQLHRLAGLLLVEAIAASTVFCFSVPCMKSVSQEPKQRYLEWKQGWHTVVYCGNASVRTTAAQGRCGRRTTVVSLRKNRQLFIEDPRILCPVWPVWQTHQRTTWRSKETFLLIYLSWRGCRVHNFFLLFW